VGVQILGRSETLKKGDKCTNVKEGGRALLLFQGKVLGEEFAVRAGGGKRLIFCSAGSKKAALRLSLKATKAMGGVGTETSRQGNTLKTKKKKSHVSCPDFETLGKNRAGPPREHGEMGGNRGL